jgi:putative transposase
MKRHYYYNIASYYVKNYDIIVMENLLIRNMSKSASGTIENPGKNVAQKRGLNRSILEQSWYLLRTIIENKCKEHSRQFILVDPKYTSQQCSECGNIFYKSLSQRTHFCKICGFQEDRDINAAHNILRKGLESLQEQAA